ncbi:MAG: DUF2249 domain-containing protein [Candidatus Competibacteraceae bacterium]
MSESNVIVVDGRELEPPEPMEKVLAALDALEPGQHVRFLIHRQPYPLYDILRRYHYRYKTTAVADGHFEVLIWPP